MWSQVIPLPSHQRRKRQIFLFYLSFFLICTLCYGRTTMSKRKTEILQELLSFKQLSEMFHVFLLIYSIVSVTGFQEKSQFHSTILLQFLLKLGILKCQKEEEEFYKKDALKHLVKFMRKQLQSYPYFKKKRSSIPTTLIKQHTIAITFSQETCERMLLLAAYLVQKLQIFECNYWSHDTY